MRIALVLSQDLNKPSGVLEKHLDQVKVWCEHGHEVHVFVMSEPLIGDGRLGGGGIFHVLPKPLAVKGKLHSAESYFRLIAQLRAQIQVINPDIIYMRHLAFAPSLAPLMCHIPTVIELNTVQNREDRIMASSIWRLYNLVTSPLLFGLSSGIVAVTHEIADTVARYHRPTCVIPNGFDLTKVSPKPPSSSCSRYMVFVGTPGYPWHGIDKVVNLANSMPTWGFEIIGYGNEALPTRAIPPNLRTHGLLSPRHYAELLANASIALGALALHRLGLHESCSLKVREYLAYGIPVLLGNRDSDFDRETWFLKVLPNDESNVRSHIDEIREFAESVYGRRVPRDAVKHLDHQAKEPVRLSFLESLTRL